MKTIERVNVAVTGEAKKNLVDYQRHLNLTDQGEALTELLLNPAKYVEWVSKRKEVEA